MAQGLTNVMVKSWSTNGSADDSLVDTFDFRNAGDAGDTQDDDPKTWIPIETMSPPIHRSIGDAAPAPDAWTTQDDATDPSEVWFDFG